MYWWILSDVNDDSVNNVMDELELEVNDDSVNNVKDESELEVNYDSVNNKWEIKKSVDLVARYWWMSSQGWTHARREAMIFDGQYSHGERSRLIE